MNSVTSLKEELKRQKNEELLEAVSEGNVKVAAKLLQSGAELDNSMNKNGCRPLHIAAHNADTEMLQCLLSFKPDLEVQTNLLKLTPLHCAVSSKSLDCVQILLDAGADFEAQTDAGERPLHLALMRAEPDLVKLLVVHGANRHAPCPCIWDSKVAKSTVELAKEIPGNVADQMLMLLTMPVK
uniref:Uncharacterized protein n=1 Tax=Hemiselmis andersenii TaxID=464988 RepID=A0A7S1HMH8_HEMAN|mmetsp:Transcript_7939/g.19417  ORF Transcript_7939/g.19417 Transcript_7939/m.19417 type:complete len:183 (+) Transcript_7939:34-582(+)